MYQELYKFPNFNTKDYLKIRRKGTGVKADPSKENNLVPGGLNNNLGTYY